MDDSQSQKKPQPSAENLEDIEVRIAILANNPSKLASMVHFLNRRGWPTTIHSQVGPTIESITKEKPNFVLLSMNHASPKLDKLPQLLEQTFNVTPILFAETSEGSVIAKLQNAKTKYKMIGTTSGPSMHRYLRKVLLDLIGGNSAAGSGSSSASGTSDDDGSVRTMGGGETPDQKIHIAGKNRDKGAIVVSGNAKDSSTAIIQSGPNANEYAQVQSSPGSNMSGGGQRKSLTDLLASKRPATESATKESFAAQQQLMNYLNSQEGDKSGSGADPGRYPIVPQPKENPSSSMSAAAQALAAAQAAQAAQAAKGINLSQKQNSLSQQQSQTQAQGFGSIPGQNQSGKQTMTPTQPSGQMYIPTPGGKPGSNGSMGQTPASNAQKPLVHVTPSNGKPGVPATNTNTNANTLNAPTMPTVAAAAASAAASAAKNGGGSAGTPLNGITTSAAQPRRASATASANLAAQAKNFSLKEPLFKAFIAAAAAAADSTVVPKISCIQTVKELLVIPVDTQESYGYGVVCLTVPIADAGQLLDRFTAVLGQKIAELKIPAELEETYVIATPEFFFLDAVETNGVFGEIQTFESGTEIAFGFFKTPFRIQPPDADENMSKIDVESISTERPVNFKAYVRMARNDKYLLYLRDGRQLLERQKKTLKQHNVLVFHVSKQELVKFRAYTAVGFFSRIAQKQLPKVAA